ncbi:MAG: T9SS type A sorting domain-containing protein, partial [Bacteroidia bacterium]|nr:T9SS type A sorting domain-containing protein [Bacteroidia bacterium]
NQFILAGQITVDVNNTNKSDKINVSISGDSILIELLDKTVKNGTISLFSPQGKNIYNSVITGNNHIIKFDHLAKGLYIVKITSGKQTISEKVILK